MHWGDHVEVVALGEVYNKNVIIFDKDSVHGSCCFHTLLWLRY